MASGSVHPISDPVYPSLGNAGLDVLHYGLDLAWEPSSKTLTGAAALRLRASTDLPEIKLDITAPPPRCRCPRIAVTPKDSA